MRKCQCGQIEQCMCVYKADYVMLSKNNLEDYLVVPPDAWLYSLFGSSLQVLWPARLTHWKRCCSGML